MNQLPHCVISLGWMAEGQLWMERIGIAPAHLHPIDGGMDDSMEANKCLGYFSSSSESING